LVGLKGAFMMKYYDTLEARSSQDREVALMAALPDVIRHAQHSTGAYAQLLQGVDPAGVNSRAALARLPVTRKHELLERQKEGRAATGAARDPFGGFCALVRGPGMGRVFASPGPIYEPEGRRADYWRAARALFAAGFRAGDLVHNAFSYHMTPGAFILESGAHAIGCSVFPAGVGQTEQQLQAIADLQPNAYTGTPSFLRILVEKAQEAGQTLPITKALVSGEACPPSLTAWFAQQGIAVYQCFATADLGLIAYETEARQGLVVDEGVIVEIVRPGTGDPVPDGEVGEMVVTTLNPDYPLIRFGTGDMSAVLAGSCPTGRSNVRIKGWMGRADQTTKIKGMFVHPGQIADVLKRHPEAKKARLVVTGEMANDQMLLKVESGSSNTDLAKAIGESLRESTKLRGDIELVAVGSLPNDGKVIEDARSYA
jgi:phenylacetate-CoA ligase